MAKPITNKSRWKETIDCITSKVMIKDYDNTEVCDLFIEAFVNYVTEMHKISIVDKVDINFLQGYTDVVWPAANLWYAMPEDLSLEAKVSELRDFLETLASRKISTNPVHLSAFHEALRKALTFFTLPEVVEILRFIHEEETKSSQIII